MMKIVKFLFVALTFCLFSCQQDSIEVEQFNLTDEISNLLATNNIQFENLIESERNDNEDLVGSLSFAESQINEEILVQINSIITQRYSNLVVDFEIFSSTSGRSEDCINRWYIREYSNGGASVMACSNCSGEWECQHNEQYM